jgi:ribonuclease P protein component
MQIRKVEVFSGNVPDNKLDGKKFSFTYFERLHTQRDFNKVFKNGLKIESKAVKILVYTRKDRKNLRRLGLITPKRVGIAVVRNRTKRRLREIFRTNKHLLKPGLDLIFISKPETALLDYKKLESIILSLLKNAKLCAVSE